MQSFHGATRSVDLSFAAFECIPTQISPHIHTTIARMNGITSVSSLLLSASVDLSRTIWWHRYSNQHRTAIILEDNILDFHDRGNPKVRSIQFHAMNDERPNKNTNLEFLDYKATSDGVPSRPVERTGPFRHVTSVKLGPYHHISVARWSRCNTSLRTSPWPTGTSLTIVLRAALGNTSVLCSTTKLVHPF